MKLKEDQQSKDQVKRTLAKINDQLLEVNRDDAVVFPEWLLKKSKYFKNHKLGKGFGDIPSKITRGDIVRVNLGVNIGDELSDIEQDGHFCLVWARKGFMLVVIPLTKTPQIDNEFAVNLGKIKGLPENVDSYAKLEQIRAVSIRRVKRIREYKDGKISIADRPELLRKINEKIEELFLFKVNVHEQIAK